MRYERGFWDAYNIPILVELEDWDQIIGFPTPIKEWGSRSGLSGTGLYLVPEGTSLVQAVRLDRFDIDFPGWAFRLGNHPAEMRKWQGDNFQYIKHQFIFLSPNHWEGLGEYRFYAPWYADTERQEIEVSSNWRGLTFRRIAPALFRRWRKRTEEISPPLVEFQRRGLRLIEYVFEEPSFPFIRVIDADGEAGVAMLQSPAGASGNLVFPELNINLPDRKISVRDNTIFDDKPIYGGFVDEGSNLPEHLKPFQLDIFKAGWRVVDGQLYRRRIKSVL